MEAAARLLEDNHIPYETIIFGHPDIYDDTDHLERLDKYKTLVLPNVDCISDRQVKSLTEWVQKGGQLVLWGEVGTRDEEMNVRSKAVFADIVNNSGKGTVEFVSEELVREYVQGRSVVLTSKYKALKWRYTFDEPNGDWFKS